MNYIENSFGCWIKNDNSIRKIYKAYYERMVYIMKMTKEHIDTINNLLVEHGEALTAFYDEGIRYGMKLGVVFTAIGVGIGASINYVSRKIKTKSDKEIES